MFIYNAWYVAAIADEVGRQLLPVRMLSQDLVLYRQEDGQPVALHDSCPHRRLPLSMGRLIGDTVECGYHGLTFNGQGQCVRAPACAEIPARAVRSEERRVGKEGRARWWASADEERGARRG